MKLVFLVSLLEVEAWCSSETSELYLPNLLFLQEQETSQERPSLGFLLLVELAAEKAWVSQLLEPQVYLVHSSYRYEEESCLPDAPSKPSLAIALEDVAELACLVKSRPSSNCYPVLVC